MLPHGVLIHVKLLHCVLHWGICYLMDFSKLFHGMLPRGLLTITQGSLRSGFVKHCFPLHNIMLTLDNHYV